MRNSKFFMYLIALFFTINSYAKKGLEQYYQAAQKATTEVCKGNYDKATEMFQFAFKEYSGAYFTDLNNALYAAVRAKTIDSAYIKQLFTELSNKGISVRERYGSIPAFAAFTKLMGGGNNKAIPVKDVAGFNKISDALLRDQAIRTISGKLAQPTFYTLDKFVLPAVRAIDSANFDEICAVLRTAINKKENLESSIGYPAVGDLLLMLHHAAPWGYYNRPLLDSCVALGVLYAPLVADLYDKYCSGGAYLNVQASWPEAQHCHKVNAIHGGSVAIQFPASCYIFKVKDSLLNVINYRRRAFFLNDVYEHAKIVSYAFLFSSEGFSYPGVEVISDRDFENSYEGILKSKGIDYILYRGKEDYDYNRSW